MTKIEILGIPQEMPLEKLATFVKGLDIKDLEIVMSTGRFEVWTSTEDATLISSIAASVIEKAMSFSTIRSNITYKEP